MWVLPLLGYVGLAIGFLFLTLAIASGLYYLSEIVEEHTVLAKRVLMRMIFTVIVAQILLAVVDHFPIGLSAFSVGSHFVYMQNLRRFPIVKLTDPIFLLSCLLVLVNHWVWFNHFSAPPSSSTTGGRFNYYDQPQMPTFTEVASFFALNVWLVPFALFVSLSAGENVLPSMGSEYATGQGSSFVSPGREPANDAYPVRGRHKRSNTQSGMAKVAVSGVKEWIGETGELMGFWQGERTRPSYQ